MKSRTLIQLYDSFFYTARKKGAKRDDKHSKVARGLEVCSSTKTCCLTTVQKDNLIAENASIRRLTPVECERLKGFPDNYTEGVSDSQKYKMLGNSYTIPVISHILNFMNVQQL